VTAEINQSVCKQDAVHAVMRRHDGFSAAVMAR